MCFFPFRLDVIFSRKKENSLQLPATRHHSWEADNPKARIKKLIAEEATERSVGHGIFASSSSSAVSVHLLLCQRPPVYCPPFTLSSPDGSLSKKLLLVGWQPMQDCRRPSCGLIMILQSATRLCSFYLYHSSCYLVCMDQTQVFT
ncbi:hypothetical protein PAHAL_5G182000 [Panicum hallii]|uniref:Uncharacterized protein n=1 Tax=Panicum hallii TaxID=206008 RepID=A0A2T8IKB4_9POAL|nr:hypothetical protein PAHAL_5G182000 [Panicum hallii]